MWYLFALTLTHTHFIYHCQKFGGTFLNVIKAADKSAQNLLKLIVENFPSFRDEAYFEGKTG